VHALKLVHTAAFVGIAAAIAVYDWDVIQGRPGRRAWLAAGVAVVESATYVSNNGVCPLTPLAEELGAASGTVTDLYLPKALSDRIPLIAGTALLAGMAVHARASRGRAV
jgi:hypothetical protein